MSSGYGDYYVESAEARQARLLAEARARRAGLAVVLTEVVRELRFLGLVTPPPLASTGITSGEVQTECELLSSQIEQGRRAIATELIRRREAEAKHLLDETIANFSVDPTLAKRLAAPAARQSPQDRGEPSVTVQQKAEAEQIIARQIVPNPELNQRVVLALAEPPATARMLLADLSRTVDKANQAHEAAEQAAHDAATRGIEQAAKQAGRASDEAYVRQAVRDALEAIGYRATELQLADEPAALIAKNAAFPQHAIVGVVKDGQIHLDPARVDGASHHGADQTFEAAMCAGLAAFRQELNKRGISQHRYTHLPPGIAPQIKRRTVQPAKRTRTAQTEQAAQR